jgi:hypothetical protein
MPVLEGPPKRRSGRLLPEVPATSTGRSHPSDPRHQRAAFTKNEQTPPRGAASGACARLTVTKLANISYSFRSSDAQPFRRFLGPRFLPLASYSVARNEVLMTGIELTPFGSNRPNSSVGGTGWRISRAVGHEILPLLFNRRSKAWRRTPEGDYDGCATQKQAPTRFTCKKA